MVTGRCNFYGNFYLGQIFVPNFKCVEEKMAAAGPKLTEFSGENPELFDMWFKKFELFVPHPPPQGGQARHVVLPLYLSGRAFMTYDALTDAQKGAYAALKTALRERLVPGDHNVLRCQEFMAMTRKPYEHLTAFELRVMEAVRLAYADFPDAAKEALAKEQFIRGIDDGDTQLHVLTQNPATLRAAVQQAEQFEQVQRIASGKSAVRTFKTEKEGTTDSTIKDLANQVKKLKECMSDLKLEQQRWRSEQGQTVRGSDATAGILTQSLFPKGKRSRSDFNQTTNLGLLCQPSKELAHLCCRPPPDRGQ